jgi:hypothetical protein
MTGQESRDKVLLAGIQYSSGSFPTIEATSLKRKSDRQDQSPTANMLTKRQRLSARSTGIHYGQALPDSGADPLPCSPQARRPLAEIQNPFSPLKAQPTDLQLLHLAPFETRNDVSHAKGLTSSMEQCSTSAPVFQSKKSLGWDTFPRSAAANPSDIVSRARSNWRHSCYSTRTIQNHSDSATGEDRRTAERETYTIIAKE